MYRNVRYIHNIHTIQDRTYLFSIIERYKVLFFICAMFGDDDDDELSVWLVFSLGARGCDFCERVQGGLCPTDERRCDLIVGLLNFQEEVKIV